MDIFLVFQLLVACLSNVAPIEQLPNQHHISDLNHWLKSMHVSKKSTNNTAQGFIHVYLHAWYGTSPKYNHHNCEVGWWQHHLKRIFC